MKAIFRTGTSNIVVPGNKQSYPPAFRGKSRLNYYSSFFNSLEINSSFYKIPLPATFEKWANDVPEDFKFTVKLWKEITHVKELNINTEAVEKFFRAADKLGEKRGCLLIQFPGKINIDYYSQAERLLQNVAQLNHAAAWKIAVEFRHASWYIPETFELLDEYGAVAVIHDIPKGRNNDAHQHAPFILMRFHGPSGDYRGSYSDEHLKEYALRIRSWLKAGKDVYAYFNNTIGNAFENAKQLQGLVKR